jgi:hypothetical protein
MQVGEVNSRYMDCTPELGPIQDTFPNIQACSITITRQDGNAMTSNDLALANAGTYPPFLDSTGLIPTFWYTAPPLSVGVVYVLTLTVNLTSNGRLFIRTFLMQVVSQLG